MLCRKQHLEASKANGQTKLSFSSHSVAVNDNHECPTAERHRITYDGSGREDSNSSKRFSDEAGNPWIKATNSDLHFSSNVKKKTVNIKEDIFKRSGFNIISGCGITEKKKATFCGVCTLFQQPHDPRRLFFLEQQMAIKTGKRARKD